MVSRRAPAGDNALIHNKSETSQHANIILKEMATHSGVLALRIPGMGEPGGLPSIGSHRVGHD